MTFDFLTKGKLKVDMSKYMKKMCGNLEQKYVLTNAAVTPAANDLFGNDELSPKIDKEMREDSHTFSAWSHFACKRA